MKRIPTLFLQAVIVLIGIAALTFLIWEPQIEGVNVNKTLFQIYFQDPFLAYAYIASIPFFVILYKTIKLLRAVRKSTVFSLTSVKDFRTIKYCALIMIGFVIGGEIFIISNPSDDRAGGVFMGILVSFGSIVIGSAAAMFERVLQNAVDIKLEHDLTV